MRLMLGTVGKPSLLVTVKDDFDPFDFKFWVVNGAWEGTIKNGDIRVNNKYDDEIVGSSIKILCEDQDRLRGDYNDVFNNFDNVNYVAPKPNKVTFDNWDDDIAF